MNVMPIGIAGNRVCSCIECGTLIESKGRRPRLRCTPCADIKERARWRAQTERQKAENAAQGRSKVVYASEEERAAARAARRPAEREREKLKRQAVAAPKRAEREAAIAERKRIREEEKRAKAAARAAELASKPWLADGLTKAEKYRLRYALCPDYDLKQRLKAAARKGKFGNYDELMRSALKRRGSSPSIETVLGYTIDELRRHLERQFSKGMTWPRFLAGDIHIDHVLPLASFDASSEEEMKAAWALTNLRPMWGVANCSKGDKRLHLL